ncbi:hypothetical protein ACFL0L_01600 [Patescibacteria group bacterium]
MKFISSLLILVSSIAGGIFLARLIKNKITDFKKYGVLFIIYSFVNIALLGLSEKTQVLIIDIYVAWTIAFAALIIFLILVRKQPSIKKILSLRENVSYEWSKDAKLFQKVIIRLSTVGALYGVIILAYFDLFGIVIAIIEVLKRVNLI